MSDPMTPGERTALRYLYAVLPEADLCGYDFSPETLLSFLRPALTLYRERAEVRALPESYFLQYVLLPRVNNEELRPVREKLAACIAAHLRENGEEALTGTALARAVNYACAAEGSYVSSDGRTISAAGFLESGQGRCGEESVLCQCAPRSRHTGAPGLCAVVGALRGQSRLGRVLGGRHLALCGGLRAGRAG